MHTVEKDLIFYAKVTQKINRYVFCFNKYKLFELKIYRL